MHESSQLERRYLSGYSNQVIQQIRSRMLQAAAVGAYKYTKHRQPVPIEQFAESANKDYQLRGPSSDLETKSILKDRALISDRSTPAQLKNVSFNETPTIKPYERDSTKPMRPVKTRRSARGSARDTSPACREIPVGSEENASNAMSVMCGIVETTISNNICPIFCVAICFAKILVILFRKCVKCKKNWKCVCLFIFLCCCLAFAGSKSSFSFTSNRNATFSMSFCNAPAAPKWPLFGCSLVAMIIFFGKHEFQCVILYSSTETNSFTLP